VQFQGLNPALWEIVHFISEWNTQGKIIYGDFEYEVIMQKWQQCPAQAVKLICYPIQEKAYRNYNLSKENAQHFQAMSYSVVYCIY
jgi:hypothetical protein